MSLRMRRVSCWYAAGIPGGADFRARACRCESAAEFREVITTFFDGAARAAAAGPR